MFSWEHIQNEVLTINSEHPFDKDHIERKSKANIYPSDQKIKESRRIIDKFQDEIPWWVEKVSIVNHSKFIAYSHFWNFVFWRFPWGKNTARVW